MMYPQLDRSFLYPIELPFRYAVSGRERISGEGRTMTMGSRKLRIDCDRPLRANLRIQLTLQWPAALPDGTRLSLWISGKTTRAGSRENLIQVTKHEFRTRRPVQPAPANAIVRVTRIGA
jgi:hypothetical protein